MAALQDGGVIFSKSVPAKLTTKRNLNMSSVVLENSVGLGGVNKAVGVALVQRLLKNYFANLKKEADKKNYSSLNVNGKFSFFLVEAVKEFQSTVVGSKLPDGKIDANGTTFKKLIGIQTKAPITIRDCILGTDTATNTINLSTLSTDHFKTYVKQYYGLTTTNGEDFNGFVDKLINDPDISDVRWAAYMLATAYIETAFSFNPVSESGKGAGRDYAQEVEVTDTDGIRGKKDEKYKNVYYGRGYVQLTWDYNYKKVGTAIGQGTKLYVNPDLALDKEIAYKVASYGMRNGSFSGKKLDDYLNASKTDYLNARSIINGTDRNKEIAEIAKRIELLLRLAMKPIADRG